MQSSPGSHVRVTNRTPGLITGMHIVPTLFVRTLRRIHGVDHTDLIHVIRKRRKVLADAYTIRVSLDRFHRSLRLRARFGVERIEMAHPARQIDINHSLCSAAARSTPV